MYCCCCNCTSSLGVTVSSNRPLQGTKCVASVTPAIGSSNTQRCANCREPQAFPILQAGGRWSAQTSPARWLRWYFSHVHGTWEVPQHEQGFKKAGIPRTRRQTPPVRTSSRNRRFGACTSSKRRCGIGAELNAIATMFRLASCIAVLICMKPTQHVAASGSAPRRGSLTAMFYWPPCHLARCLTSSRSVRCCTATGEVTAGGRAQIRLQVPPSGCTLQSPAMCSTNRKSNVIPVA